MKRVLKPKLLLVVGVCLVIIGGGVVAILKYTTSPIPSNFRKVISYPVFLPTQGVKVNASSYKFDFSQKVLSFTGSLSDGQVATFTEQATPEPINDISGFYTQFLQTLNQYAAFDSLNGTVNLTHPNGGVGQAAVMNAKGTLMFIRVARDESQSAWQAIFNRLKIAYTG